MNQHHASAHVDDARASAMARHQRALEQIGDANDPVTVGRRNIVARHEPGVALGPHWVDCGGPHGREGGEYTWPCDDYRDAAADADQHHNEN